MLAKMKQIQMDSERLPFDEQPKLAVKGKLLYVNNQVFKKPEKGSVFIAYAVRTKSIGNVRRAFQRIRINWECSTCLSKNKTVTPGC